MRVSLTIISKMIPSEKQRNHSVDTNITLDYCRICRKTATQTHNTANDIAMNRNSNIRPTYKQSLHVGLLLPLVSSVLLLLLGILKSVCKSELCVRALALIPGQAGRGATTGRTPIGRLHTFEYELPEYLVLRLFLR